MRHLRLLTAVLLLAALVARPAAQPKPETLVFGRGADNGLWFTTLDAGSNWRSLGGDIASAPDASSWGADRVDVFVRGRDDRLWSISRIGGSWTPWAALDGPIASAPAATSWGPDRIDVFAMLPDRSLGHKAFDGKNWSPWQSLGGRFPAGARPDAASGSANRLDVFMRGEDNALWRNNWNGSQWSGWTRLGGVLHSDPGAAAWDASRLDVFALGTDNSMYQMAFQGGQWTPWYGQEGRFTENSSPNLSSSAVNRIDAVARGTDDAVWLRRWDGAKWAPWQSLGGRFTSDPSIVATRATTTIDPSRVPAALPVVTVDTTAPVLSERINALLSNDSSCRLSNGASVEANWSFEQGYICWRATGDAFGNAPVTGATIPAARVRTEMAYRAGGIGGDYWTDLAYPLGVNGNAWVGTFEVRGDEAVGRLTSRIFPLSTPYITLLMGGGVTKDVYVSLEIRAADVSTFKISTPFGVAPGSDYVEVARLFNAENSEELKRVWFDLPSLIGLSVADLAKNRPQARLVIVDDAKGAWGHINVDDIRFETTAPQKLTLEVRTAAGVKYFDPDHPVWGFADTHTHPAAYLGFGGRMIVGDPTLPLEQTYATAVCDENHGGAVVAMAPDKSYLNFATAVGDPHFRQGAPDYLGYPRFNVKLHQGYHPDWFRRAFDGGERLVVALAVNNQYLATRALGEGIRPGTTTDDHSQTLAQLALIKQMVAAHTDFMDVAYTPADARRIILSGRMAVVLGAELDTFGNFKDESFIWSDNPVNHTLPLVTLSRDRSVAKDQLAGVIREYRDAGARQFTAVHYVDGLFSGVPVFRIEPLIVDTGYTNRLPAVTEGRNLGVAANIVNQLTGITPFFTSTFLAGFDRNPAQFVTLLEQFRANAPASTAMVSTVNALGLTERGEELMLGLMRQGLLIDSEHLSFRGKNDLFALAQRYDYPIMSSHTDVGALSFRPASWPASGQDARAWGSLDDSQRFMTWGTSNPQYLATEFQALDSNIEAVHRLGGTVGIFTMPYRKTAYAGSWRSNGVSGRVRNDADGSSKTWAQMFLHAAEQTGGHGIALATDRAGTEQIGPRFGPYADWPLSQEAESNAKTGVRWLKQETQAHPNTVNDPRGGLIDKGVRYDHPIGSFHPWLYEFGDIPVFDEDVWKALAFITAYPSVNPLSPGYDALPASATVPPNRPQKAPLSSEPRHDQRIESFVRGWYAPSEAAVNHPGFANLSDRPWEEVSFYLLRHNLRPTQLTTYSSGDLGEIWRVYTAAKRVFDLWAAKDGDNAPLRRLITGTRHWDFNLDGLAHYGLIPDFLQDLRNVGINAPQMDALFSSAEDYIRMWEKAEIAADRVPR